jgi:hypothetical protein
MAMDVDEFKVSDEPPKRVSYAPLWRAVRSLEVGKWIDSGVVGRCSERRTSAHESIARYVTRLNREGVGRFSVRKDDEQHVWIGRIS